MLKVAFTLSAVLSATLTVQIASAHGEGDLSPREIGGKIVLGAYEDGSFTDLGVVDPPVFGQEIGPINAPPSGPRYEDATPGMQGLSAPSPGNQLPAGRLMSDLLTFSLPGGGTPANLFYWDGMSLIGGEPVFSPATAASLTLSINGTFVVADGSTNASQGLFWGNKTDGVTLHNHATSSLYRNPLGALPAEGMYLLAMNFYMTDGSGTPLSSLDASDPVFLVYRAEESGTDLEPAHELAIEWVEENYGSFNVVPEPMAMVPALIGTAFCFATWHRRRKIAA